jgi:isopenicillin N synthase-like dioxygenase
MAAARIPTLDIRDFKSNNDELKHQFVQELRRAYEDTGFVIITGHNIGSDLQAQAYDKIDAFFKLPPEVKRAYEVKGVGGARGYTSFGKEHAKDSKVGDLKEFFHVGAEVPADHPLAKIYPKNVSVTQVSSFDTTLRRLYNELLALGMDCLRAVAIILQQPENFFDERVRLGNSILRPIHYPPLTGAEPPGALRSAAHEDINLITLLIGASSPGLEVKTRTGDWLPVTTAPSEIVVNVGDMLQRLTNYRLKSVSHRVTNPPASAEASAGKPAANSTRFSIPFFLHPVSDMSLRALPTCMGPGEAPKDPPTTAGEYLEQRLREIGLL